MNNQTMFLCFVDDEPDTVEPIVTELRGMRMFEIREYDDYASITQDVIDNAELFVLDVWTGPDQTSKAFVRFVRCIAKRKPFIAFTTALEKSEISLPSGDSMGLRKFVLSHAGLGVVTKRDEFGERWRREFRLDVMENILTLYWSTRSG